jgi:hypothetical protein
LSGNKTIAEWFAEEQDNDYLTAICRKAAPRRFAAQKNGIIWFEPEPREGSGA